MLFTQKVYTFHRKKVYTFLQNYNYILQTTEYQTLNSIRFYVFCH